MEVNQYDVILMNMDPTIGSEIHKTRPCLVISPAELNKHLKTIVIAPMTTSSADYPTPVKVYFKRKHGRVAVDQIRTIDKRRMIKKLGHISDKEIMQIKLTIAYTFVD